MSQLRRAQSYAADRARAAGERTDAALALGFLVYVVLATAQLTIPLGSRPPFPFAFVLTLAAGCVIVRLLSGRLDPLAVLVVAAIVGMALTDLTYLPSRPFNDLDIYLKAGRHFLAGEPVYSDIPLSSIPRDRTNYPFLYPPFALPIFGVLGEHSGLAVHLAWLLGSIAAILIAFRLLGIRARWFPVLLAWPPVFVGLFTGNVAVAAALLLIVGPWFGGSLVLTAIFKAYDGVAAAWLVRQRRWGALLAGAAVLIVLALATLPLTGIQLWRDWAAGLVAFSTSEHEVPAVYGAADVRYVPVWVAVALTLLVVVAAFRVRGTKSLARFGIATIVASPSLYSFGFIPALPAFAYLPIGPGWLAIAITSVAPTFRWWLAIGIVAAGWALAARQGAASKRSPWADASHAWRLLERDRPWPTAPDGHDPAGPGSSAGEKMLVAPSGASPR
jgi:hypothetical protein